MPLIYPKAEKKAMKITNGCFYHGLVDGWTWETVYDQLMVELRKEDHQSFHMRVSLII